ncbi:MAG: hypothetical protein RBT59_11870 [Arcobacteraceae bacterium]|jgi:hypothetical protein|nr:hypothetical protein [Arcobacteraceae bacterium]
MKAIITEVTRANGKVQYDVFYGQGRYECRTLKSATATADKLNRFNGSFYATHLQVNSYGKTLCNTRGDQTTTKNESEVTCPRCLAKLAVINSRGTKC